MGRGLKYIKSLSEAEHENCADIMDAMDTCWDTSQPGEKYSLENAIVDDDQNAPFKWECHPPGIVELDDTSDRFPHFDEDSDIFHRSGEDSFHYEADEDPRRIMKLLHATLVATIGIAYSLATTR